MKQSEYTAACAERLKREGYREVSALTEEVLRALDPEGGVVLFRCVAVGWGRVGAMEAEETVSLVRYYGADSGVLLTNGRFTSGARFTARQAGNLTLIPRYEVRSDRKEDYDALL